MKISTLSVSWGLGFALVGLACSGGSSGTTSGGGSPGAGGGGTSTSSGTGSGGMTTTATSSGSSGASSTSTGGPTGGGVVFIVDGMTNNSSSAVHVSQGYQAFAAVFPAMPENKGGTIAFKTAAVGTYDCVKDGPFTGVTYTDGAKSSYGASSTLGSCTIDVTKFGAVGDLIDGTFTSTLQKGTGPGPAMVTITGSFSVVRSM
ncbi:MAG: hypothetical protein ABJE95_38455 [Byssovorax sp.]